MNVKWFPLMAILWVSLCLTSSAQTPAPAPAAAPATTFKSPGAAAAQRRYLDGLQVARQAYAAELDPIMKAAMARQSLAEANALNELKGQLLAGTTPPAGENPALAKANNARLRFEKAVADLRRQYSAGLDQALKVVMTAGQIEEANAINTELKSLGAGGASPGGNMAAATPVPFNSTMASRLVPGLLFTRYPKQPQQTEELRGGYVPYSALGSPLGPPATIADISTWRKEATENATVTGFIRIERAGTYEFRTQSDWDRNELMINGKIICAFQNGRAQPGVVKLQQGFVPVISIGYYKAATEIRIRWKPPQAKDFVDIPAALLFH